MDIPVSWLFPMSFGVSLHDTMRHDKQLQKETRTGLGSDAREGEPLLTEGTGADRKKQWSRSCSCISNRRPQESVSVYWPNLGCLNDILCPPRAYGSHLGKDRWSHCCANFTLVVLDTARVSVRLVGVDVV